MENIIKAMENTNIKDILPVDLSALAERVPEDERAIDEVAACPMIGEITNVLTECIPQEEQAIEDGEREDEIATEVALAEKRGCFSAANGMAQIKHVLDGRLFASLHVDAKGNRNIAFCERYDNGKFSPKMQIAQWELILLNNFIMEPKSIPIATWKSKATKVMTELTMDYFNKFNGDIPMDMTEILKVLAQIRTKLPVYEDITEADTAQELYTRVYRCLETNHTLKFNEWIYNHKAYYALDDESLEIVAEKLGMKPEKLAEKLKTYNLLYLTNSSTAYKTKVRITRRVITEDDLIKKVRTEDLPTETTAEWCYCIYKLKNLGK